MQAHALAEPPQMGPAEAFAIPNDEEAGRVLLGCGSDAYIDQVSSGRAAGADALALRRLSHPAEEKCSDALISDDSGGGSEFRPLFPGCAVQRPVWPWLKSRFTLAEASGSLGDLGTFIPLVLAMARQNGLDFGASLLFAGLYNVATGLHFPLPMAVQPMKAIAAVALREKLSPAQIMAAGIIVSGTVFFLGLTRLVDVINRTIPTAVVKGMQLGLGLNFLMQGFGYATQSGWWWGGAGFDCVALAIICGVFVLAAQPFRRVPSALVLFVLGIVCALAARFSDPAPGLAPIAFGPTPIRAAAPSAEDFRVAFVKAAIPQIPLTTLNSVVSVTALANELFPAARLRPSPVALFVGAMNLIGGWFGSAPYCHGAGGLAGQYKFGARSNVSILFLGACKVLLYLVFGASLAALLSHFPLAVLGVLLGVSGLELASSVRDQGSPRAISLALVTAAGVILYQTAVGLAVGLVAAAVLEVASRFAAGSRPPLGTAASLVVGPSGVLALVWPPAGRWGAPVATGPAPQPAPLVSPALAGCSAGAPLFAAA